MPSSSLISLPLASSLTSHCGRPSSPPTLWQWSLRWSAGCGRSLTGARSEGGGIPWW